MPAQPEARPVVESDPVTESGPVTEDGTAEARARRRRFLAQLGEFRRSRVLVPVAAAPGADGADAPLTVEWGGVRWILAFTGEAALARFAVARGEGQRAWRYRGVWGAAVLDAAVPTVAASGVPCGVVVNAGDGERGLVLAPVAQIVPEQVAVDQPEPFGSVSGIARREEGR